MNTQKIKTLIMTLLAITCCIHIISCSESDTISEDDSNNQGVSSTTPTKFIPTMDWGANNSEVRSKQNKELSLTVSTESLLRYTDKSQEITIDYNFDNNKLTGTSLTQAKISSINAITNSWLKGYHQLAKSETTLLYASQDNSALAYGKIVRGGEYDYASIAWTYIDKSEETNGELDFSPSGQENGYDYVDLGIGIGWAVQNVGASSPDKSGGYYMWGETTTKTNCWWWYYSLYKGDVNNNLNTDKFYTPYPNISGTSYDAAKARLGGNWRMPTRAELYTLINNCEFNVGEYNGIRGFIVTGPSGKSIFLPATGIKKKDEIRYTSVVYLWSSTSYDISNDKSTAYHLEYMTQNLSNSGITFKGKYYGMPIRGVVDLK